MGSESPSSEAGTIRVLVVDDHPRAREAIAAVLKLDCACSIVGEAMNGEKAVDIARATSPDIVLMDINLPGIDGFEATKQILNSLPRTKVIMISHHDEPAYKGKAIEVKASGYIRKSRLVRELLQGIQIVHSGSEFFPD